MINNSELANVIESFIEKYWKTQKMVEWPESEFRIIAVNQVKINENSLKNIGNLWTFEGTAFISISDISQVEIHNKLTIIGNATITFSRNSGEGEKYLPTVQHVVNTRIQS